MWLSTSEILGYNYIGKASDAQSDVWQQSLMAQDVLCPHGLSGSDWTFNQGLPYISRHTSWYKCISSKLPCHKALFLALRTGLILNFLIFLYSVIASRILGTEPRCISELWLIVISVSIGWSKQKLCRWLFNYFNTRNDEGAKPGLIPSHLVQYLEALRQNYQLYFVHLILKCLQ